MMELATYSVFCLGIIAGDIFFISKKVLPNSFRVTLGVLGLAKFASLIMTVYFTVQQKYDIPVASLVIECVTFLVVAICAVIVLVVTSDRKRKNSRSRVSSKN